MIDLFNRPGGESSGVRPAPAQRGDRPPAPGLLRLLTAALLAAVPAGCAPGDREAGALPPTRAERTGYEQTTGYGEVVQFVTLAADRSERIHSTTFGSTVEGRPLALAVVGDVADARPASVVGAGRLRVWLQGAIHGGEVAGKEALLMLLRNLAAGGHAEWSSSMTLLVAPVYNADGHERMGPDTRPYQLGPFAGQGERANAQGLDLNRDHMKLESPEARALARAYEAWDPHVVIDLHTTNGTEHAYHLTYSPPLHPNTHPAIDALLRDEWLPAITRAVEQSDGWRFYYYGNLPFAAGAEPSWRTFDHRPRFNNNYVGLRNRVALLAEAYAYAPFDERIRASLRFVEEALAFAHDRAGAIAALVETADAEPVAAARLATRAAPVPSAAPVEILLGRTEEVQNPYNRAPMRRRLDVAEPTPMVRVRHVRGRRGRRRARPRRLLRARGPRRGRRPPRRPRRRRRPPRHRTRRWTCRSSSCAPRRSPTARSRATASAWSPASGPPPNASSPPAPSSSPWTNRWDGSCSACWSHAPTTAS